MAVHCIMMGIPAVCDCCCVQGARELIQQLQSRGVAVYLIRCAECAVRCVGCRGRGRAGRCRRSLQLSALPLQGVPAPLLFVHAASPNAYSPPCRPACRPACPPCLPACSGGFRELCLPIARELGVPPKQLLANRMNFQERTGISIAVPAVARGGVAGSVACIT